MVERGGAFMAVIGQYIEHIVPKCLFRVIAHRNHRSGNNRFRGSNDGGIGSVEFGSDDVEQILDVTFHRLPMLFAGLRGWSGRVHVECGWMLYVLVRFVRLEKMF